MANQQTSRVELIKDVYVNCVKCTNTKAMKLLLSRKNFKTGETFHKQKSVSNLESDVLEQADVLFVDLKNMEIF